MALSHFPIIELDTTDSTNNYAMQLIDANKAQQGLTIVAQTQLAGKGQRGKSWLDAPGQSLLMTIIALPKGEISTQFAFNCSIAVAVANVVQKLIQTQIHIKWPNDIIIDDKKAGGILIENILRGNRWTHSAIGLGLNVKQASFPPDLPTATSIRIATGDDIDITALRDEMRDNIMQAVLSPVHPEKIMAQYNEFLYKRTQKQAFWNVNAKWEATILAAHKDGTLEVQLNDGSRIFYQHGHVIWDWGL